MPGHETAPIAHGGQTAIKVRFVFAEWANQGDRFDLDRDRYKIGALGDRVHTLTGVAGGWVRSNDKTAYAAR